MSIRTNFAAVMAGAMLLATPLAAQDLTADTVVATVNGTDITLGHVIALRESLPDQYQSLPDETLYDGIVAQLVQQTILAEQTTGNLKAIELRLENERRSLLAGATIQGFVADAVTDETLQAAYDEKYSDVEPTKEFNASHILVETQDEAAALVTELEGGADFAELAVQKSTGPSGPNGGELGWFGPGMMVKPFEDAVVGMEVGQVSAPIETQFGWHVIKLNETRNMSAPTLDEVRGDLAQAIQETTIEKALSDLEAGADVVRPDLGELDKSIIRNFALIDN